MCAEFTGQPFIKYMEISGHFEGPEIFGVLCALGENKNCSLGALGALIIKGPDKLGKEMKQLHIWFEENG